MSEEVQVEIENKSGDEENVVVESPPLMEIVDEEDGGVVDSSTGKCSKETLEIVDDLLEEEDCTTVVDEIVEEEQQQENSNSISADTNTNMKKMAEIIGDENTEEDFGEFQILDECVEEENDESSSAATAKSKVASTKTPNQSGVKKTVEKRSTAAAVNGGKRESVAGNNSKKKSESQSAASMRRRSNAENEKSGSRHCRRSSRDDRSRSRSRRRSPAASSSRNRRRHSRSRSRSRRRERDRSRNRRRSRSRSHSKSKTASTKADKKKELESQKKKPAPSSSSNNNNSSKKTTQGSAKDTPKKGTTTKATPKTQGSTKPNDKKATVTAAKKPTPKTVSGDAKHANQEKQAPTAKKDPKDSKPTIAVVVEANNEANKQEREKIINSGQSAEIIDDDPAKMAADDPQEKKAKVVAAAAEEKVMKNDEIPADEPENNNKEKGEANTNVKNENQQEKPPPPPTVKDNNNEKVSSVFGNGPEVEKATPELSAITEDSKKVEENSEVISDFAVVEMPNNEKEQQEEEKCGGGGESLSQKVPEIPAPLLEKPEPASRTISSADPRPPAAAPPSVYDPDILDIAVPDDATLEDGGDTICSFVQAEVANKKTPTTPIIDRSAVAAGKSEPAIAAAAVGQESTTTKMAAKQQQPPPNAAVSSSSSSNAIKEEKAQRKSSDNQKEKFSSTASNLLPANKSNGSAAANKKSIDSSESADASRNRGADSSKKSGGGIQKTVSKSGGSGGAAEKSKTTKQTTPKKSADKAPPPNSKERKEPVARVKAYVDSILNLEYDSKVYCCFYCVACPVLLPTTQRYEEHLSSNIHKQNVVRWRICQDLQGEELKPNAKRQLDVENFSETIVGADQVVEICNTDGAVCNFICVMCSSILMDVDALLNHLTSFQHIENYMEKIDSSIFKPPAVSCCQFESTSTPSSSSSSIVVGRNNEAAPTADPNHVTKVFTAARSHMMRKGRGSMRSYVGEKYRASDHSSISSSNFCGGIYAEESEEMEETLMMSLLEQLFAGDGSYKVKWHRIDSAKSVGNETYEKQQSDIQECILGLQSVVEIWFPNRRMPPVFYCTVCKYMVTNVINHCSVTKHWIEYMNKCYKSIMERIILQADDEAKLKELLTRAVKRALRSEANLGRIRDVIRVTVDPGVVFCAVNAQIAQQTVEEMGFKVTIPKPFTPKTNPLPPAVSGGSPPKNKKDSSITTSAKQQPKNNNKRDEYRRKIDRSAATSTTDRNRSAVNAAKRRVVETKRGPLENQYHRSAGVAASMAAVKRARQHTVPRVIPPAPAARPRRPVSPAAVSPTKKRQRGSISPSGGMGKILLISVVLVLVQVQVKIVQSDCGGGEKYDYYAIRFNNNNLCLESDKSRYFVGYLLLKILILMFNPVLISISKSLVNFGRGLAGNMDWRILDLAKIGVQIAPLPILFVICAVIGGWPLLFFLKYPF